LEGQFHEGVDPVHLLFSNTYTTSATLEMDLRAPAVLRERLDSIRQLVRRGISFALRSSGGEAAARKDGRGA
jgi:hypothetical protein